MRKATAHGSCSSNKGDFKGSPLIENVHQDILSVVGLNYCKIYLGTYDYFWSVLWPPGHLKHFAERWHPRTGMVG